MTAIDEAVSRLASRTARPEANLQADIYVVLTSGALNLGESQVSLESPARDGTRRRLDIEIGRGVIEVKKDLRVGAVRAEGVTQLGGYVAVRSANVGTRYSGILTDGTDWHLYDFEREEPQLVSSLSLDTSVPDTSALVIWLEAILTTQEAVPPTPLEITRRLGASSPGHLLDHASLMLLYERGQASAEVGIKRNLWAKLLRTAFGEAFVNDPNVFVDHTLLVLTAEAIAHAAVGYDISGTGDLSAEELTSGTRFSTGSQIHGVVESDFFDWVLDVDGGKEFVLLLKDRLSKFDWSHVEHDVLKHLYESVITPEARASLGEYYTPDWLADRMIADALVEPLTTRALDPSCGSGTFLFHAVRAYLDASDAAGISVGAGVTGVTESVFGLDIHPVAVTLARVTYLLAIGTDRLASGDRGPIAIPVYLGDSLQWDQHADILASDELVVVETTSDELVGGTGGGTLLKDSLAFPRRLLQDATQFDLLVSEMSRAAMDISGTHDRTLILPIISAGRYDLSDEEQQVLMETFATMRALHRTGRDHIWGYYVRNLLRPLWLATPEQRVDLLVGNPPWLRYNKMTPSMQDRYRKLAKARQLLSGGLGASARDLSTLFVTRSIELYLKMGGRFSFVMPHGVMSRRPHSGFRRGDWSGPETGDFHVRFDQPWDTHLTPTGFPMSSCVLRGWMTDGPAIELPPEVLVWSATSADPALKWAESSHRFSIEPGIITAVSDDDNLPVSPYKQRFRSGAIIYPRFLFFVDRAPAPPLGAGAGRVAVESRRSTQEKVPFKDMASLHGTVDETRIFTALVGESVSPFRITNGFEVVLPIDDERILTQAEVAANPDLAPWWAQVEESWASGRRATETRPLLERFDYHGQMTAQLPPPFHRVVYPKSGNGRLAAARIEGGNSVIDNGLFWARAESVDEARYLTGILNSGLLHDQFVKYLPVGLFGIRDVDKYVFNVPFGAFEPENADHKELIEIVEAAELVADEVDIEHLGPDARRVAIRAALVESGHTARLEATTARILPPPPVQRPIGLPD